MVNRQSPASPSQPRLYLVRNKQDLKIEENFKHSPFYTVLYLVDKWTHILKKQTVKCLYRNGLCIKAKNSPALLPAHRWTPWMTAVLPLSHFTSDHKMAVWASNACRSRKCMIKCKSFPYPKKQTTWSAEESTNIHHTTICSPIRWLQEATKMQVHHGNIRLYIHIMPLCCFHNTLFKSMFFSIHQ